MATKKVEQSVSGECIRNAGTNYTENTTNNYFDLHAWKHQAPMSVLNQSAIENEFNFIERFGFDASEEQRRQVIAIKEHFDLTDLSIKLLKRSGALTVKNGKPVSLHSDWIGVIASILLMLLCSLVIFAYSIIAFTRGDNFIAQVAFVAVLFSIYVFFCFDLHRLTIKPARILRENGIKFGQKFTLPTIRS